ncbi:VanZ family protein [Oceanobacillus bengalensis]|uniref:VanZ family protein n=1 Tax=Oceanobacillus bengalensis TaxID=1435466 RepID=UPI001603639B
MGYLSTLPFLEILLTLFVYSIGRYIYLKRNARYIHFAREIIYLLLLAYTISIFHLTILSSISGIRREWIGMNLIPFQTIRSYINLYLEGELHNASVNIIGNIVVFIPLGCLLVLLDPKILFKKIFVIGFLFSFVIEILQLLLSIMKILSRSFDVDDLFLNTVGVLIGYLLVSGVRFLVKLIHKTIFLKTPLEKSKEVRK